MVTVDQLSERKTLIETAPDLQALLTRLTERAAPVLARMPPVPRLKALLSTDGGVCPEDGAPLVFDPWSPSEHRCSSCGRVARGERHDRHWAKHQHLWLAERAAHLAAVGAFADHDAAAARAREILASYEQLYFELPNRDNVLGPTHLFFSTYLESIWILNIIAAATLLRESGQLDEAVSGMIDRIADEAANIIADFNEGFSNRQTWHAAALTAIAGWFNDEELARQSVEERTGLLGHLADGFGEDGTWYEGENYHLFALRGLLTGLGWSRAMGADLLEDPAVADHLRLALLAPTRTALPDFTFPARKDSRFGVSLAQPMYLELWEVGQGMLGGADPTLSAWLAALYGIKAQPAFTFESYLHEAGEPAPASRSRADLSWWSFLTMVPALASGQEWSSESRHFRSQGLTVLRRGSRYASLEGGIVGGGHGHPDRLHLTVHDQGVHWLPDFGTGSYVAGDLFWYRSTLAHNAPLIDNQTQPLDDAVTEMFEQKEEWGWTRARFDDLVRTVVAGPRYLLDVITFSSADPHRMDLPWHLQGETTVESSGRWEPAGEDAVHSEFVAGIERFAPEGSGPIVIRSSQGSATCRIHLLFAGSLLRARAPGPPGTGEATFYLVRGEGRLVRVIAVLETSGDVRALSVEGDVITVDQDVHTPLSEGWQINTAGAEVRLAGRTSSGPEPLMPRERTDRPGAVALWIAERPALDGSEDGFDLSQPLSFDAEMQYRRSEEPYPGPESFSASAWINWTDEEILLLVDVAKEDVWFRPGTAPPLRLDNEVDDIHSDGLQVYFKREGRVYGFVVVPEEGGTLRVSAAGGTAGDPAMITGGWSDTGQGYRVSLAFKTDWALDAREELSFDLLINEMRPGRQRRAGQLVWSGLGGRVYLQGDRQNPAYFGSLTLAT